MDLTPPQLDALHEGYKSLTTPAGDAKTAEMPRRKRGEK